MQEPPSDHNSNKRETTPAKPFNSLELKFLPVP